MHTWSWQTWEGSSYLTCSLLSPWPHGFFTRQTWPQTPDDLISALRPGIRSLRVKQVHGNRVLNTSEILEFLAQQGDDTKPWPEADGLVSDISGENSPASKVPANNIPANEIPVNELEDYGVWACSADCTPILIADERTGSVAAVHAGWRGTAAKVLPHAIVRMQVNGSNLSDLRVAMGPAIAGEVYQVPIEVAAAVGKSLLELDGLDLPSPALADQTITEMLMEFPSPPILPDDKPGHVRLDVRQINVLQLEQIGLSPLQISVSEHCTFQDPERFFSYRRDNLKKVQWSGIVSRHCELAL